MSHTGVYWIINNFYEAIMPDQLPFINLYFINFAALLYKVFRGGLLRRINYQMLKTMSAIEAFALFDMLNQKPYNYCFR